MSRDPIRKDDSFIVFEEVLQHARVTHDCDMMLLGGDLFHENKPTLDVLQRTIHMFRKYCMGNKDVAIELRTDPKVNFPTQPTECANFQDPNMNIALPIFTIHGNHDDPIGGTSAIDILASAGLVNYFGHTPHIDDIVVRPVILRKGRTQIALYGIGNVRDERFHRALKFGKVSFVKPAAGQEKFFNILIVHQNRGTRGYQSKNGIHDNMFAKFGLDLVIWGNEHEQIMGPTAIDGCSFDIIQPGSTIHTSLNHAETQPKACAILEITGTSYTLRLHKLRHVRPVVRRIVALHQVKNGRLRKTEDAVEEFLKEQADDMIKNDAQGQVDVIPDDVLRQFPHLKLPLIRIAVDFTDPSPGGVKWPMRNANRFGQQFIALVANAGDMLKEVKPTQKEQRARDKEQEQRDNDIAMGFGGGEGAGELAMRAKHAAAVYSNALPVDDIRSKISDFLAKHSKDQCQLLAEIKMTDAVYSFVEKGEKHAVDEVISEMLSSSQKAIWKTLRHMGPDEVSRDLVLKSAVANKQATNQQFAEETGMMQQQQQQQRDADDSGKKDDERVQKMAVASNAMTADFLDKLCQKVAKKDTTAPRVDAAHLAATRRRDRDENKNGNNNSDDDFPVAEMRVGNHDGLGSDDDGAYNNNGGGDDDDDNNVKPRAPAAAAGGTKTKAAPKASPKTTKAGKKPKAAPDSGDIPVATSAPTNKKAAKEIKGWMNS